MAQTLPLRHIHIFGDESSNDSKQDFLVYGTANCQDRHHDAVKKALAFPDIPHEFHWKKSRSHMWAHKQFINAIFECIRKNQLSFSYRKQGKAQPFEYFRYSGTLGAPK